MAPRKCKTGNSQKRKNFVAANTIMVHGSMTRLSADGMRLIVMQKNTLL
jgi:hypothetical protein